MQNKKQAQSLIKGFFEVLEKGFSDPELVYYSLCHLDGILEDKRTRIKHYIDIMNSFDKPMKLISQLMSFLTKNNDAKNRDRDIASHILSLIIE